jgi:hypothetical protein
MSRNTRCLRRSLALPLFLLVTGATVAEVNAPPLAPSVLALLPEVALRGRGELTFFGLSIYDGYFWSPTPDWSPQQPFALELVYHHPFQGADIAKRSVVEITRLGYGSPEERARWSEQMERVFPDVSVGDRLTGVNLPDKGVRFFRNGRMLGEIDDCQFARAFFAIWLDPRTSEPALRQKLLGEH